MTDSKGRSISPIYSEASKEAYNFFISIAGFYLEH